MRFTEFFPFSFLIDFVFERFLYVVPDGMRSPDISVGIMTSCKVCFTDPNRFATSFHWIRGNISVMANLKSVYFYLKI